MEPLTSLLSSLRAADPRELEQEFRVVRSQAVEFKKEPELQAEAGARKENIKKNRYRDILPYDQSRVVLLPLADSDSDYINASFIKRATPGLSYIASQAPLSATLRDFWRMIWQHDVKVIVMACREVEMGKTKSECYWAPVQTSAAFGPFTVYNQGETFPTEDLVVRSLTVTFQQENRLLIQYQYLAWFDHDVPTEATGVLDMLQRARASQGEYTSPLLVHCSAGCGRTGVVCALDYIHDLLVAKKITADFSVMELVLQLRRQRPAAVQTKEQYCFIFSTTVLMLERLLESEDSCRTPSLFKKLMKAEETTERASTSKRQSRCDMSDTYAVVNKARQDRPSLSGHAHSTSSRAPPNSHDYDNESAAAAIYSTVKPREQCSAPGPALPTQVSSPANHRQARETPPRAVMDSDYEDFSSLVTTDNSNTGLCSPAGIGFNYRVQRPRGPRDPPAGWSRPER
ncbi:tyrosine-protein phosphatase non-receptor type 18 [Nelusetta ayraudi]|uniref:tyrosine-protein phosphatase non-receptor type 18 n=1 Tax=Nelusetta ayraudi TaxID=303726 RepID=UPI003F70FED4